jgi:hypothetical protein
MAYFITNMLQTTKRSLSSKLQGKDRLDGFQAIATFKTESVRVIGVRAVSRVLRHFLFHPI